MALFKVLTRSFHSTKALGNTVLHPPNPKEYTKAKILWRNLTYFVAFPAIGLCMVNAYLAEKEHMEHLEHHRPEFVKYDHMYIRKKKFPWGDGNKTLFHNPKVNALPEGYED